MDLLSIKLPSSMTKPFFGTIVSRPITKLSSPRYKEGIELDFYPNFTCRKPKSNWNLAKFDYYQFRVSHLNSSTPTARNTRTIGSPISGPRGSPTTKLLL